METNKTLKIDSVPHPPIISPVRDYLLQLLEQFRALDEGAVADYIPELGKANPDWFAISVTTADGKTYEVGDCRQGFTVQSLSKPLVFGLALEDIGWETMLEKVGVEPTGEAFNSIAVDEISNRPHNPMVNAGAIVTTSLVQAETLESRIQRITDFIGRLAARDLTIEEAVYRSEHETGHRNRAIAHLMRNFSMLEDDVDPILDAYFRQCSILVTSSDLSMIGASLANGGINPVTGQRVLSPFNVRCMLSVMGSCGMYDFAGEWAYQVGMPAKSGVSGGIIAVLPGQLGIGVFSPRVDPRGNSVRGIRVCHAISERFGLHQFGTAPNIRSVVRREYRGDTVSSHRIRTPRERDFLEREGYRVLVIELQGLLYFGAAERLLRFLEERLADVEYLVLDFARITGIDKNTVPLLDFLSRSIARAGVTLLVSSADRNAEVNTALAEILLTSKEDTDKPCLFFPDVYAALEKAEQALLAQAPAAVAGQRKYALRDLDLFKGLNAAELGALEQVILALHFPAGQLVLREGDPAKVFFVLASGSVSVHRRLPGSDREIQLASVGPGVAFGEMALMDQGNRSATIRAEEDIVCYALSMEKLDEMSEQYPNIRVQLLRNIAQELAGRLRRANDEIASLFA